MHKKLCVKLVYNSLYPPGLHFDLPLDNNFCCSPVRMSFTLGRGQCKILSWLVPIITNNPICWLIQGWRNHRSFLARVTVWETSKIQASTGLNLDLCDASALLCQLRNQANWELVIKGIHYNLFKKEVQYWYGKVTFELQRRTQGRYDHHSFDAIWAIARKDLEILAWMGFEPAEIAYIVNQCALLIGNITHKWWTLQQVHARL